jgi:MFS family permease
VPSVPGALRERDFRLVFASGLVSLVGDAVVAVALAFAILGLTGSASDVGLVLAVRAVALVAGLLAGGVVADRVPRRDVMIAADGVRFAAQAVVGTLLVTGTAELWVVALLQVPLGAASGFFNPALSGLLPGVVSPANLQGANALRGIAAAVGGVAGPAVAAALIAVSGPGEALLVDAGTYALSAALLLRVRRDAGGRGPRSSFLSEFRGGWHEVRSRPWVGMVIGASTLGVLLGATATVLGPVVADEHFGGASGWALIRGAGSLGGVVGGLIALRVRPRRPLFAGSVALTLFALPQLALAGPAPLVVVAAVSVAANAGVLVFTALWETALQQHVPAHALGRVTSFDWIGSLALQPVGMALAGPLAVALGTGTTLLGAGLLELLVLVGLAASPAIRAVRAGPPGSAA